MRLQAVGCDPAPVSLHGKARPRRTKNVPLFAARTRVRRTGAGVTTLGTDPLGGAHLQVDDTVEGWSSLGVVETTASAPIPNGVLLTAPTGAPDCCCGS